MYRYWALGDEFEERKFSHCGRIRRFHRTWEHDIRLDRVRLVTRPLVRRGKLLTRTTSRRTARADRGTFLLGLRANGRAHVRVVRVTPDVVANGRWSEDTTIRRALQLETIILQCCVVKHPVFVPGRSIARRARRRERDLVYYLGMDMFDQRGYLLQVYLKGSRMVQGWFRI